MDLAAPTNLSESALNDMGRFLADLNSSRVPKVATFVSVLGVGLGLTTARAVRGRGVLLERFAALPAWR